MTVIKRIFDILKTGCYNLFGRNAWGWFHLTTAVIVTSLLWRIFPHNLKTVQIGVAVTGFIAIVWEIFEYWYEIRRPGKTIEDVYGTKLHYWQDTIGDILLAVIGFFIALI